MLKNIYNLLIYTFYIFIFLYVSRVLIWFKIVGGDLDYLDILKVLFTFIIDILLVLKILSIRSYWKTLFFKYANSISWKKIFRVEPFIIICITLQNSFAVSIVAFQYASSFGNFENNIRLLFFMAIMTIILTMILFEFSFLGLLFMMSAKKSKHNDQNNSTINNQIIFPVSNSKITLVLSLVSSIILARFVSKQINNYLLNIATLDLELLIIRLFLTSFLLIFFINSLNSLVFKKFKLKYNIDVKTNIGIFLFSVFLFVNGVYFVVYLATASFYFPLEISDPFFSKMDELYKVSMGVSIFDPNISNVTIFFLFLLFSLIFVILLYLLLLYYFLKRDSIKIKWKSDQKMSNNYDGPFGIKGQKIIKRIFSKQLRNQKFTTNYSRFYYFFIFFTAQILSLAYLYILVKDSTFGNKIFNINLFEYQYVIGGYFTSILILSGIFYEVQKIHKFHVTDFINKNILLKDVEFASYYYPIVTSCLITIFIRDIYQISEKYGGLIAPESIKTFQLIVFFLISEYILSIALKRFKDIVIKGIEEGNKSEFINI